MIFLLLVIAPDASAARRRVVFQLANLHQWTEFEYAYDGNTYSGTSDRRSQNHKLEEKYHLDIDYAILGRKLANGSLDLDVGFDQSYEDESGSTERNDGSEGFSLDYLMDMLIFEQTSTPISLYSSRNQERVNEPFTKSHDLISQHFSSSLSLKNKYLPTSLSYNFRETETDGLAFDRFQSSTELRLKTYLKMGEFSTTDFGVETRSRKSQVDGRAQDSETDTYSLEVNNILNWKALSQRQALRSSFRKKNETGTSELDSDQWDERLRIRLGKGLETEFSHEYRWVETPRQFRREQKSEFWIEHHLFKSLVSRYQHTLNRTDFDTGTEESWMRQASLAYNKKIMKDSRIRVAYNFSYGETDRNLESNVIVIGPGNPESALIDGFFEVTLAHPDVVQGSIVVSDAFGVIPDSAYDVNSFGRLTVLDFSSNTLGLSPGDAVSIEYEYNVNNSIEYSTTTHGVSTSLDLASNSFRIYANLNKSDQDLLDGEANVSTLVQQSYLQVGVEANLDNYSLGTNYAYLDSTINTEEYIEAFLNFSRERKGRAFRLRLTERYNSIQQKEGPITNVASSVEKNSLTLHMNYRRQLARNSTLTMKMFLADIRGDNIEKDEATFGLLLESRWYKFLLRVNADVTFELNDGQRSREEQVSVALRRYF